MVKIRKSQDRGHIDHGWLETYHTFSFANYYDPAHMGFRALRVINEDRIIPSEGFDTHSHKDMEIITYVLEGALKHQDSMGHGSIIKPGEVQYMSAGTGVSHSEFNASEKEPVHLLQIWIIPNQKDMHPRYDQKRFTENFGPGKIVTVASPFGEDGSIAIRQDAKLLIGQTDSRHDIQYKMASDRYGWVQISRGSLSINDKELNAGDGAEISHEVNLQFSSSQFAEFLLFDLA